ncbi:MAG: D-alanyl-D-alanine carboxypeptidase [Clostridia bacterium]|nr:D-alanyl-D-alanine carboxypeptidase [Clostridia bacterium]
MEVSTNRVLFANNIYEKKYMASTTKILTAIIIIEKCDLNDTVEIGKKTVGIEGSSIYLEAGEKLTVKDLLYGLMLRSGNDCAETLAVHCSGSVEKFADLMNETARKIGAKNSHFINPHGLHDDDHYTTAYDLALISCYAMKNCNFKEIVSTKSIKIPYSTHDSYRFLTNKNKLLKEFDGATGIKTGFTKKAGRCLVGSCYKNGMDLVSVVLNCGPMFERSKSILQTALDGYKMYNLVESDNIIAFIPIKNTDEKRGVYIKNDLIVPLTEDEYRCVEIKYELPDSIKSDLGKDREIGFIKIYCKNNLIFSQKVYTIV